MKKLFFLFAMLTSVATTAQTTVQIMPVSATYTSTPTIQFQVSWTAQTATNHRNKVWVFVDFQPVISSTQKGAWQPATITGTVQKTAGTISEQSNRGFFLEGTTTNFSSTVTVQLSNIGATQFNWCAYGSDYPPNATITAAGYQLKGAPPFSITYNNGSSTITDDKTFSLGCINTLTDATGCPGLVEALPAPTSYTDGARCNAGTVNISATPPTGCTIDWYTTALGTTKVTNGTGVTTLTTPSISTTTVYYAESRHLVTGCVSSSRRAVTATVTNGSGRDLTPNACNCASGLTACNGKCRNLSADAAICYNNIEVKLGCYGPDWPFCSTPSGWTRCAYSITISQSILKLLAPAVAVWCQEVSGTDCRYRTTVNIYGCVPTQTESAYWLGCR
jgi:hypothetical protein